MRTRFLAGSEAVHRALAEPDVARLWDEPSVLEEQTVGSLAGHLARGGVWIVDEYLDLPLPDSPRHFDSAAAYYDMVAELDDDAHTQIRDRGATIAAAGHDAVLIDLGRRLQALRARLPAEPTPRPMVVAGGVMDLDDYLQTRLLEQVVHLVDLARSLDRDPAAAFAEWDVTTDAVDTVIDLGTAVARRQRGDIAVLNVLFRLPISGAAPVLPVL